MTWRPALPLALLVLAAFFAPLIGGQVATDTLALAPDLGSILKAMLGAPLLSTGEAPLLSHWFITALVGGALLATVVRRRILQLPWSPIAAALMIFLGLLLASLVFTRHRMVSLAALCEWVSYGVAFFAVVMGVGRHRGVLAILSAMFAASVILALWGILAEFPANIASDPGYRLFMGWVNPNASAGMLLIGLFCGIGLLSTLGRLEALLCGTGCVAIGVALVLTGSKGAIFLGLPTGALIYAVLCVSWNRDLKAAVATIAKPALCVMLAGVLALVIQMRNKPSQAGPAGGLGRLADYSQTQEQSAGFRKLLYTTSGQLIRENAAGFGIGTFRFESARPGLTTQTQLAHNSMLQLAVESSILAPLSLLALIVLWAYQMLRCARSLPVKQNLLRAAVCAAVAATLAQGLVESNLYYYGIGLCFFMLLGVGLLLAGDAVAPEFTPRAVRVISGIAVSALILQLGFLGYVEARKAQIRGMGAMRQYPEARDAARGLTGLAPGDGEAYYLAGQFAATPPERLEAFRHANDLAPTTRYGRALARQLLETGNAAGAQLALQSTLEMDPNNLAALRLQMDVLSKLGDEAGAIAAAKRLVNVEQSPYFKIRALPEFVPTETAEARIFLADAAKDPAEQAALLEGALATYVSYAQKTAPVVKRFAANDPPLDFSGETPESAARKVQAAIDVAGRLANVYGTLGLGDKVRVAETTGSDLKAVLASVLGAPRK